MIRRWRFRRGGWRPRTVRRTRLRRYRRYGTRYRPRTGGRGRGTKSGVVKLTFESLWVTAADGRYNCFNFVPSQVPGFDDYRSVYTQFRFVKAKLDISRCVTSANGEGVIPPSDNYLVVGSRPFAETTLAVQTAGGAGTPLEPADFVPPQLETDLRQTRWQRVLYPSAITQKIHLSFKPYTMTAAFGPTTTNGNTEPASFVWQRTFEASRWMPFTWAGTTAGATTTPRNLWFFGPYMVQNTPTSQAGPRQGSHQCTLTLYAQFRGQK